MRRPEFDHVVAAAANVTGFDAVVVIGSQAILGPFPDAPAALLRSQEADVYPRDAPGLVDEIEGALGDGSPFARAYGYFAHGVGPETAKAPAGWQDRLVLVDIEPRPGSGRKPVAHCLEPHDLVLAKCAAGRERDWEYAGVAIRAGLVRLETLLERAPDLPVPRQSIERIQAWLRESARAAGGQG